MKNLFLHDFKAALNLWANNQILKKFEPYNYVSGQNLYLQADPKFPNLFCYNSPYKPWIADESIASSPSGIISGSTFIPKSSGLIFDYENGRIMSPVKLGNTIKCDFTYSQVGVHNSVHSEEQALFENRYLPNSRFAQITETGVPSYDYLSPCVLLTVENKVDNPFSFGGEDETIVNAKAMVICDNDYHLDGLLSVLGDSAREVFPNIKLSEFPFNFYWDKTGSYNYENFKQKYGTDVFLIEESQTSRLSSSAKGAIPQNLCIGFVDFKISQFRYPRQ